MKRASAPSEEKPQLLEVNGEDDSKRRRIEHTLLTRFDPNTVETRLDVSSKRNQYGGVNFSSRLKNGGPFVLLLPRMTVAYVPSVWDEEKQAKYGKEKDKQLNPDRKSEHWSLKCECTDRTVELFHEKIIKPLASRLCESRHLLWPNDMGKLKLDDPAQFQSLIISPFKRDGERNYLHFDALSERGNFAHFPVPLIDAKTGEHLPPHAVLGDGSEISCAASFSRGYAGASSGVKIYVSPVVIYVHKLCDPPRASAEDFAHPTEFDD